MASFTPLTVLAVLVAVILFAVARRWIAVILAAVVTAVGGDLVSVTSVLDDPSADPHSFEASPRVKLDMSEAALVVVNGGGYDDFAQKIVDSDDGVKAKTVEAFPLKANPADDNEHVWFDPVAVKGVVGQVADRLSALEPAQAQALHQRAAAFAARVDTETGQLAAIGRAKPGSTVISTEPIAHYLLGTAGVTDVTPGPFVEAIENENDPSAAVLSGVTATIASRGVTALVFNPQTETPVTEGLRGQASAAGVPVVNVTETLPAGKDYLQWLDSNRTDLARALGAPA
jgi:zinc/manganese transport system substrate-binding protein